MSLIYQYLEKLNIKYRKFSHRPVFTVEEGREIDKKIPGIKTKNLFLRDKKKTRYFLLSTAGDKEIDLKKIAKNLNTGRLSFASSPDVEKFLKIKPGAVSPFNLVNNKENKVVLVIDKEILGEESVNFHPNDNRATLNLKTEDFQKYLDSLKNKIIYLSI